MNEHLLSLIGFTPEQWERSKSDYAFKMLSIWQRVLSFLTLRRLKFLGGVLLLVAFLYCVLRFLGILLSRAPSGGGKPPEASSPAVIKKELRFEGELEDLRHKVGSLSKEDPDLIYPSLETEIKF